MTDPIVSNSYAVAYRLIGNETDAHVVAESAAKRVRERFQSFGDTDLAGVPIETWLPMLMDFTVDESVRRPPSTSRSPRGQEFDGLREALRRRLVRASRQERVIGSLVHLCGYTQENVATMLNVDEAQVAHSAKIIAPPPGINYRDLGDPQLVGEHGRYTVEPSHLPRQSTIAIAAILLILVILATRCTGPRPSFEEGSAGVVISQTNLATTIVPDLHHDIGDPVGE